MTWEDFTVYAQQVFRPATIPAIDWIKKTDSNWSGDDRGASEDVFETEMMFIGPESELAELEEVLHNYRDTFDMDLEAGEELFGADIDISSTLTVAVTRYGRITRRNFQTYQMPLRLRLPSPSYTGSASISDLRIADNRYMASSGFDIAKSFALDGSATYLDGGIDAGIFRAVFRQTTAEIKAIRRYLLTTARTADISFPSVGVSQPFGQRMGSGPFTCKVISWRDLGRKNFVDWEIEITFARVL